MTPDHTSRELIELLSADTVGDEREACPLAGVWREAEAEAHAAYAAWRRCPDVDAYVTYLAAEERAAAAQDELASWARARDAWGSSRASLAA
jgi:hypothetical protein